MGSSGADLPARPTTWLVQWREAILPLRRVAGEAVSMVRRGDLALANEALKGLGRGLDTCKVLELIERP